MSIVTGGVTTVTAAATSNLAVTQTYNATNWTVTGFDLVTVTAAQTLTVANTFFDNATAADYNGSATGALVVDMVGTTLNLGADSFGTITDIQTTITGTAGNDTITFANAKAAGSSMVVNGNGGNDTFRFEGASGNATGGDLLVIADAVSITDFNSANDIITGESATLLGVNLTTGNVASGAWDLNGTGPGFALITGATVADFSNLAAVSAAVGAVTATATDVAYFAVTNINESQVGIYRVAFAATGAATIVAGDDLTLVSVIDNTGDFNALNLGLY